jgi:hypothetical protein
MAGLKSKVLSHPDQNCFLVKDASLLRRNVKNRLTGIYHILKSYIDTAAIAIFYSICCKHFMLVNYNKHHKV